MKKYLLLRDNRQSGPLGLDELIKKELLTTDLIWVEGESTAWKHPQEIEGLSAHEDLSISKPQRRIYVSRPWTETRSAYLPLQEEKAVVQDLGELKERIVEYPPKKINWNRQHTTLTDIVRVMAVFAGLIAGAFLIKKMVDDFSLNPVSDASVVPANIIVQENEEPAYKNALLTEVVPARDTIQRAPVKKVKPKELKKQLSLKGNAYKVGMLGGINGLQLKLQNTSPHAIEKITVAVQYLKPNGEVVHTDQYDITGVRPFSSKTLDVPDSRRGVKVNYKILEIHSKEYKKAVKQV